MRAVEAIMTYPTLRAAATAAGVSERVLRKWRSESPAFQAALGDAARRTWQMALMRLQRLATQAPRVLRRNMHISVEEGEEDATPRDHRLASVEVRAVAVLLQHLRDSELAELSARVAALEEERGV